MTEEKFQKELKKIQLKNQEIEFKNKLKVEKNKHKHKFKLPSTSKLVLLVVFLMCIEILIFSQYAMIKTGDISAMYTLIGVPVTLVPVTLGYYWKAKNENTAQGLVYEERMYELNQPSFNDEIMYVESDEGQG